METSTDSLRAAPNKGARTGESFDYAPRALAPESTQCCQRIGNRSLLCVPADPWSNPSRRDHGHRQARELAVVRRRRMDIKPTDVRTYVLRNLPVGSVVDRIRLDAAQFRESLVLVLHFGWGILVTASARFIDLRMCFRGHLGGSGETALANGHCAPLASSPCATSRATIRQR